ncbi:MAG: Stk1 family PASTA domain-containing Ser/Thr kinase [Bariatricus sp.]|nr:Stk1 family PASTA domain-containing Ser/Thr kinase [Bariatricus sp.]
MVKDGIFLGNRYEVLSKIGAGGMADVYKGRDCMLNRYVAIKVLKKEYREDESFVRKFRSEAQAAAGLLNPNIVNVYDVGEDRGLYYMVMELVEGITLKEYIQKKGRLSNKEAISISIQMCTGIEAAHKNDIIHRDIKPQNIIISKEGKVKVTDFGIAKAVSSHTVTSSAMGSVHYVSPEQARGGFCDAKSDIYSVGITMYEMATGQVPFDGDSTVSVAMKHLQEPVTPPSELVPGISPAFEKIILKCTQKSPERRYQNVGLLIQDLKRALVDPDGSFVDTGLGRDSGDTVMISSEDMGRIRGGRGYDDSYDEYEDENEEYSDGYDDEEDEDEDYRGRKSGRSDDVNPRMNKMMKILTIVVAVIIAFVLIFVIGKAVGVFKFGPGTSVEESDSKNIGVPLLVGEEKEVAEEMCNKRNLEMKVVSNEHSDKYPANTVIRQNVEAGTKVAKKTVIEVVVSSGEKEVEVENVEGMDQDEAWDTLKEQGFTEYTVESEYSDKWENGVVIRTTPAAGEKVTVDTKITLVVSKGAEKKEVPQLVGKTVSVAQKLLADAGLEDGGSSEQYSDKYEAGVVISQSVNAGTKVESGTSVSYVVSKGKKPADQVKVPTVTGKKLADAISALSARGLSYEEEPQTSDLPSGTVISVDPGEGTSVDIGSTVKLYVSDGSAVTEPGDDGSETQQ